MIDARLPVVPGTGTLSVPADGRIAVFQPAAGVQLPGLPAQCVEIIQGFRPDYEAWMARGYSCATDASGRYDAAVVCLPRAKREARALVVKALELTDGPVIVDGQKTDGVDSLLRDVKSRVAVSGPVSKAHGKLFVITGADPDLFDDWRAGPEVQPGGFWTAPGVFSADGVDAASELLAQILPEQLGKNVVDLGAGWGYLSAHILTREDIETVHLVEAGHMALECARHNVTDSRARFHWADATTWQPDAAVETVVMNPPFHTGRAAAPGLGQAFITSAAKMLTPRGQLWMVANRHLPYEATLNEVFARVNEVGSDHRFKLFHATRPLGKRR